VASSLLDAGDEVVVCFPNYTTNLETPRAIGASVRRLELLFDEGFRLNMETLAEMVTDRTRLISLTTPHNPTGTVLCESELRRVVEIAESCGAWLLVDETYRGLSYVGTPPTAASLSPRAMSISSLSKTWGLPGLRLGWLLCRDPDLKEIFLAAKEQIHISTSVLDEEIAWRYLKDRGQHLERIRGVIDERFSCLRDFMAGQTDLEWVQPDGGVIAFPRLRGEIDVDRFYQVLNDDYGTFVGPGHWFDMDRRYMRIGYGWPEAEELARGLDNITKAAAGARG
jgi:aspartate/methionine/tyrosine aminotransferase